MLRPFKDRFRKLLTDRDPGLRQVAAWALARTGDLDVVPALIDALSTPTRRWSIAARLGLQLLSRKIDGLGPPTPSTPEQRQEAARKLAGLVRRRSARSTSKATRTTRSPGRRPGGLRRPRPR